MHIYYKDNGFYLEPQENALEISEELHIKLIEGQSQGKQIMPNKEGFPILTEPAPTPYHTWNGMEWEIDKEQQQSVISAEKSAKLAEINAKAQAFVNQLAHLDETPEFERETWPIQREEAKAWQIDPHATTPTLALIAQVRGVPLDVLRQKAFEKAMAYQTVAAVVAGQRQAYEDRLNMAETLEQIQAIEPVYQLPMNEEEEDVQNDES